MTKAVRENERNEAIEHLRKLLKPGDTVYTVLRHVSRSGMTRGIDVYMMDKETNEPVWITGYVGKAIDQRQPEDYWRKSLGLKIGGCGMDMGFHVVYTLSRVLFREGFGCIGEGCPSNDHSNGDRDYRPHGQVITSACRHCGKGFDPALTTCPDCVKPTNKVLIVDHMHTGDGGYALRHKWL